MISEKNIPTLAWIEVADSLEPSTVISTSPSSTHPPAAASCNGNTPAPRPRMSAFSVPAKASVFQARRLLPRLATSTAGNGTRSAGLPRSLRFQDNSTFALLVQLPAVKFRAHSQSALQVTEVYFLRRVQKHRRGRAILQALQAAHERKPRLRHFGRPAFITGPILMAALLHALASRGPTQKNGLCATSQRWPSGSLK
jgi:hypothetical protein